LLIGALQRVGYGGGEAVGAHVGFSFRQGYATALASAAVASRDFIRESME
jgi:hypothetical protein